MIASDIFLFSYDGNKEYSKNRLQELGGLRIRPFQLRVCVIQLLQGVPYNTGPYRTCIYVADTILTNVS